MIEINRVYSKEIKLKPEKYFLLEIIQQLRP